MKFTKRVASLFLAIIMVIGTAVVTNGFSVKTAADTVKSVSYWSGNAATAFYSGVGTKDDPFIIATADQLNLMVLSNGKLSDGSPAYYRVKDGVRAFYLNDADTLSGVKALVAAKNYKNWESTGIFCGIFDGNGVTIYGMVSYNANAFIYALDESYATIKNINFDSCYVYGSGNAAVLTTRTGSYTHEILDLPVVANVSVRNVYVETGRNITVNASGAHSPSAAGLISTSDTTKLLTISNCLFDGYSSELVQGKNSTADATAGMVSGSNSINNITLNACVSLGAQVMPQAQGANYTRYDVNNNSGFQMFAYNCYCDLDETVKDSAVIKIDKKSKYEIKDMPGLDWLSNWKMVDLFSVRVIPMPIVNRSDGGIYGTYSSKIAEQINGSGAYNAYGGPYPQGTYGMYYKLIGSGSKEDPYLIYNAFDLARAIASGGMNFYNRVYYKLACDIDAFGMSWITQDSIKNKYVYVEFNGELDGDGHTVSGISAGDDQAIGLIPVLAENGVVKNLHIRNSCFVSGASYAGAIAGQTKAGSQVIGCSVENCQVSSEESDLHIIGENKVKVQNCYYIAAENSSATQKTAHFNEKGAIGNIDVANNSDVWYISGEENSIPRLKNHAASREYIDIDSDGKSDGYTAKDIIVLRKKILSAPGYENVYGDINRDGNVNISDMAVLHRQIVGDYDKISDGFWRNAELGKISIYYGENDNYDAARRLEIYLEQQLSGVDIQKVVSAKNTVTGTDSNSTAVYVHSNDKTGSPKGSLEIIVGDIANYSAYSKNSHNVNDYSITYDEENCVLWLNGGSFTGVEQAVIDFISNSNRDDNAIYTVENATLVDEKQAKTVMVDTNYDGKADTEKTLYYAWGDEFDGVVEDASEGENAQISFDNWNNTKMNSETARGTSGNYRNVESANEKEMSKLYWVEDGKLSITRGVKAEYATEVSDRLGYVRLYDQDGANDFGDTVDDEDIIANPGLIKANHSMLWKQGYAEMYGRLPSDGHTFASWWMLGHGADNNTRYTESLFSKVYKLNNVGKYAYDGTTNTPVSTDLTTYKYQIPTNHFEIDIWELMQNPSITHSSVRKTKTTGSYDYRLYLNVHKFYRVGADTNQGIVNLIDWDNPDKPKDTLEKENFGSKDYYFSTSAAYHDFTDGRNTRYSKNLLGRVTANYIESLQKQLTAPRRYGFYWSTNGVDKFNFTLYIYDANGDGVEDDNAIVGSSNMTYNTDSGKKPQDYDVVDDAVVANQYMYFLFDNVLYTSNPDHNNATDELAVMHTDMLTDEGTTANPDKINLEIDYVRVYQYDDRRDIITRDTEDFNNGNHFGY